MQTTGASLLAFNQCSSPRVQTHAQDSRSAHGLLYLAAVWVYRRASRNTVKVALTLTRLATKTPPVPQGCRGCLVLGRSSCVLETQLMMLQSRVSTVIAATTATPTCGLCMYRSVMPPAIIKRIMDFEFKKSSLGGRGSSSFGGRAGSMLVAASS